MSWDTLLYLSIIGTLVTAGTMFWVALLGIRYRKELPKLPILRDIEALSLARDREEAELAEIEDELRQAKEDIREGDRAREFLDQVHPQIQQSQADLQEANERKALAEREAEAATRQWDDLKSKVSELEEALAPLKVSLAETQAQLAGASEELERYEAMRGELTKIEARLPGRREEAAALAEMIESGRSEVNSLEAAVNQGKSDHARLQGIVEGLEERKDDLGKEIERRLESIEELKRLHSSAGGIDEDHDSRQDLWRPFFSERKESGGVTGERQRLDRMEQMLNEAKVRIPRRMLDAFHTALKVQDISPLTVLAGISGTGKSLLPSLYSKCMGLHFLNLPVQPGWNSPHDLFGFYNYIEHRFKATPLARALVQFDQFNRDSWPVEVAGNQDLGDQLLLVLLDEMNLARVEYYFSELLSRLEIRRSIDPTDPEERQKAEIALEIGHATRRGEAGVEDISVSIYPGENVLFAGTMNEDESTMSLSDKVLDRATVLRFGKPAKTMTGRPELQMEASSPLALSSWKRWLAENHVLDEIQDAVIELSEIMAKAGTPFGHRVAQGIIRYVAMYPDASLRGQKMALVDQIEQKILPKLRGRESTSIHDPLRDLCSLVDELEDRELVTAIQRGDDPNEGTFMWFGLDREEE